MDNLDLSNDSLIGCNSANTVSNVVKTKLQLQNHEQFLEKERKIAQEYLIKVLSRPTF